jgi:Zn-dependent protease
VHVARILFAHGPSLDLADVLAPGADELPMALEAGGPPLLRVERLRMVVAAVVAAAGLSPRSREHFHRGGRGVPVPELTARPRKLPRWAPPVLVVASVAVLVMLLPDVSVASILAIHVALLLHEVGHALAMRLVRTEVRGILFLPALGAATFAEHPYRTRWDDVRVALSGPLTGIPVAVTALVLWTAEAPPPVPVRWGLVVSVFWNLLNLFPFVPMDGGRVLVATVAGLPRPARVLFTWAPLAVAVAILAFVRTGGLGVGTALLLALGIVATRLSLRRLDLHQWVLDMPLDPARLRGALRDLTWSFGGAAREDVDGGVPATPMTPLQMAATVGLYVGLLVALGIATVLVLPLLKDTIGGL